MIVNTICYKIKTPRIYNKGTTYEKRCDTFLTCYGYNDPEANKRYVDSINKDPEKFRAFCKEQRLNPEEIEYFYHHQQQELSSKNQLLKQKYNYASALGRSKRP